MVEQLETQTLTASSMASSHKGKFFALYLLLFFAFPRSSRVFALSVVTENEHSTTTTDHEPNSDESSVLIQHQIQLEKLEELVKNLSELVSRLESQFSGLNSMKIETSDDKKQSVEVPLSRFVHRENVEVDRRECGEKIGAEGLESRFPADVERGGPVSVTKYSPFWSERFQFVSAVKLDSIATCINVLPFRDYEGLSKYVAVGDDRGRVYVFLRNGDVLVEFYTLSDSPITAILSYMSVYKNETVLVTGHMNGLILVHKIWEVSNGEDWSSLSMENVRKFALPETGEEGSSITMLEVHHVGRTRYILSMDVSKNIRVFRENGTLYGLAVPTSRPLVFLKQRLLFLTETGAGSLDLRTMKVRESECEGLNQSRALNYVFDATERSKAYGLTSDGDLIHVLLLGDIMNFKCRVRSKRKVDLVEPLAFQAIKGYLLIADQDKVSVYNVSSQHYIRVGGPRLLFSAGIDEIRSSFLNYQSVDVDVQKSRVIPLLVSDREKLVILGLGDGYVGMYHSNLPIFKGELSSILWTSPVFFFILFLFGAWQFFAKKKEVLTSWGPDDPFSSSTSMINGAPLGPGSGDRSFVDSSSRSADIADLRSGLRGPPRRYASPSRYPGGSAGPFRPSSSADTNTSRPASVDPNFRAAPELKFRGPNLESAGFHKRREREVGGEVRQREMAGKAGTTPITYSPSPTTQNKKKTPIFRDVDWVRPDGRGFHECRPAFLRTGAANAASGSAYAEFGNTKVIVSVFGPRESKKAMMYSDLGRLNCDVSYTTFATPVRGQVSDNKEFSSMLHKALEGAIILDSFPKTTVDVFALVLESGGSDLPVVISCASLALADAGILMYDLVASVSVSCLGKNLLIDPISEEEGYQDGSVMITCMPSRNEVTQLTIAGEWSTPKIHEAMELCLDACSKLGKIMRSCLKETAAASQE